MSKKKGQYIALEPGFQKPAIGDIVAVEAVDWGMVNHQTERDDPAHTIVRGRLYGEVIVCNDEWITLAPQTFSDGGVRNSLSIPWVTISTVVILEGMEAA